MMDAAECINCPVGHTDCEWLDEARHRFERFAARDTQAEIAAEETARVDRDRIVRDAKAAGK